MSYFNKKQKKENKMNYFIGSRNTSTQTVLTDSIVNLGNTYRKYCKKVNGLPIFSNNGNGITLNAQGMYHITATFVGSGTEAGDITIQALANGLDTGFVSTQTVTTADTEIRTFVIDFYQLVDTTCLLGCTTTVAQTISFENIGVGATFTSVVVNAEKVV